jgi:hypothetical protein
MPKLKAGSLTLNYDQQGTGAPLILIPFLTGLLRVPGRRICQALHLYLRRPSRHR